MARCLTEGESRKWKETLLLHCLSLDDLFYFTYLCRYYIGMHT